MPAMAVIGRPVLAPFDAPLHYRELTWELSKRDLVGRYRGATFGLLWSLISPFLMLVVYTFAFGTVMGGRWPQVGAGSASFSIILFTGLIVHGLLAECLGRAPVLVSSQPNLVKRVIFPLAILPWPMLMSALFHTAMNVVVFVVLRLAIDQAFSWTVVLLPLVLLPFACFLLGISWMLAALGVYLRDITQVTGVVSTALLFLSTALMPLDAVPEPYRWAFRWNPITPIIDQAREVMLWGRMPDWGVLGVYLVLGVACMYAGLWLFSTLRKGFADVI